MLSTRATPTTEIDVNVDAGDLHLRVRGRNRERRADGAHGEADAERGRNPFAGGSDSEGEGEGDGEGEGEGEGEGDGEGMEQWGADEDEVEGALALEAGAWGEDEGAVDAHVGGGGGEEQLLGKLDDAEVKTKTKRGRMRAMKAKLKNLPTHLSRLRTRKSSARCEFLALHGEEGLQGAPAAENPFADEHAAPSGAGADTMDGCEWTTWNGFRDGDADAEMASPPRTPTMDTDRDWASFPVPQRSSIAGPPRTPSPSKSSSSPLRTSFSTTTSSPSRTSYSRRSSMRTAGSVHSSASKSSARKARHGHGQGRRGSANLKNGVSPEKVRQAAKRRGGWPPKSQLKLMQVLGHDAAGAVARTAGGMSESALRMAHFEKTMKEQLRRGA